MNAGGWALSIAGIVVITMGILIIRHKEVIAHFNAGALRAFSRRSGRRAAEKSTPARIASTGAFAIFLGFIALALAVLGIFTGQYRSGTEFSFNSYPSNPTSILVARLAGTCFMLWGLWFILFRKAFLRWAQRRYDAVNAENAAEGSPAMTPPPRWFPVVIGAIAVTIGLGAFLVSTTL